MAGAETRQGNGEPTIDAAAASSSVRSANKTQGRLSDSTNTLDVIRHGVIQILPYLFCISQPPPDQSPHKTQAVQQCMQYKPATAAVSVRIQSPVCLVRLLQLIVNIIPQQRQRQQQRHQSPHHPQHQHKGTKTGRDSCRQRVASEEAATGQEGTPHGGPGGAHAACVCVHSPLWDSRAMAWGVLNASSLGVGVTCLLQPPGVTPLTLPHITPL